MDSARRTKCLTTQQECLTEIIRENRPKIMYSGKMTPWLSSLYIGVFLSSLIGSVHCVGMCGGLILSSTSDLKTTLYYHVGRLFSYLCIGSIAGYLSEKFFSSHFLQNTQIFTSIILSSLFFSIGYKAWRGRAIQINLFSPSLLLKFKDWGKNRRWISPSLFVGASSGLLPCGWLHTFVIAAIATQSPLSGAALLFVFWLGTLPALVASSQLIKQITRPLNQYSSRMIATILVALGFANLTLKCYPLFEHSSDSSSSETCPLHSKHGFLLSPWAFQ